MLHRRPWLAMLLAITAVLYAAAQTPNDAPGDAELEVRQRYEQALERNPLQEAVFDKVYESYLQVEGLDAWANKLGPVDQQSDTAKLILLGRIFERQFKTEEAVAALEKVRELGETRDEFFLLLGTLYYQAGLDEKAVELLTHALDTAADPEQRAESARMLGAVHLRNGNHDEAIAAWKRLVDQAPEDVYAQLELAEIYEDNRMWKEAVDAYTAIVDLAASDPYRQCRTLRSIGRCQLQQEQHQEAIVAFERALDLVAPGNWLYEDLKVRLVGVYQDLGDLEGLAAYLNGKIEAAPNDVEFRDLLAETYGRMGRFEQAEAEYRFILERDPQRAAAYEKLILLYERTETPDKAIEAYETLIEMFPSEQDYLRRLGEFHLRNGQPEIAKTTWQRVLGTPPTARHYAELAAWYEEHDYPEDAVAAYQQSLALSPDRERTFRLAAILHSLGREDEALATWQSVLDDETSAAADYAEVAGILESFQFIEPSALIWQKAVEKEPENLEYRLALAQNMTLRDEFESALPLYDALAKQTENVYIRDRAERGIVDAYRQLGSLADKQEEWRQTAQAAPNDDAAVMQLGRFYEHAGNPDEALNMYHMALAVAPENPDYLRTIAKLYRTRGRVEEAIEIYNQLITLDKERAGGYYRELVDVYFAADLRDQAIEAAKKVVETAPSDPEARLDLAQIYQAYQRTEDALEQYRYALRLEPNEPQYHRVYGEALAMEQRFGEAQEAFRKMLDAAAEDETRQTAVRYLAGIYSEQNQLEDLQQEFRDRVRNTPKKLAAYEELAAIYHATGDPMRGIEILEEGFQSVDDKVPALKSLVRTAYEAQDYERVVAYYEQLIAESGKPSAFELERLGTVYSQLGDIETAKETWAKIVELEPDKSESYKTLVRAYERAGLSEEAMTAHAQALELDPDDLKLRYEYAERLMSAELMGEALEQLEIMLDRGGRQEDEEKEDDDEKEKQVKRRNANQSSWQQFQTFSAHYSPGRNYYRGGWQGDFAEYRPQIIMSMARIAENSIGVDEFLAKFEQRVEDDPDNAAAKQDLMLIYQTINRPDDALKIGEELIAQRPNDVRLTQQLAALYSWRQNLDRAAELMQRAMELEPSTRKEGLIALANLQQRKGDNEAVANTIRELAQAYPTDFQLLSQLVNIVQQSNQVQLLDELRGYAEKIDPQYRQYLLNSLAGAYRAANQLDRARELFLQVLSHDAPQRAYAYMGRRMTIYAPEVQAVNQYYGSRSGFYRVQNAVQSMDSAKQSALEALLATHEGEPEKESIFAGYVDLARGYSRAEGAAALDKARDAAWLVIGYYASKEKFDKALETAELIKPDAMTNVEWANLRLFCLEQHGAFDDMLALYDELEDALPSRKTDILKAKTATNLLKGDYEQVANLVRELHHRNVPPQELVSLVNHLVALGEDDLAKTLLEEHLSGLSRHGEALAALARLHAKDQNYEKAFELAQEAWKRQPQGRSNANSMYAVYYGYYYSYGSNQNNLLNEMFEFAQGCAKTETLIAQFKERLEKQPGSIQNYENLAAIYGYSDDRENAEAVYRDLIEKRPHYSRARMALAEFYASKGRYQDALDVYEEMIEKTPNLYQSMSWRMHDLYARMGQGDKLAEIEDKAAQGATNVNQLTQLAYELRERGSLEKAAELFERVIMLDPGQTYYLTQLVDCYTQLGRIDDAMAKYASMLSSPVSRNQLINDTYTLQRVVELYAMTGRVEELNQVISDLQTADPNDRAAKAIRAQLHKRNKEFDQAVALLDELIKSGNNYGAMNNLIEIATLQGEPQRILDTLERSGMLQNYWNSQELIPVYLALGDKEKAYEAIKQIANNYGGNYGIRESFQQLINYQLFEQAADYYRLNRKKLGAERVGRDIDRLVIGAYTDAGAMKSLMDEILAKPMKGETIAFVRTLLERHRGDIHRARTTLTPLLEREPDNAELKALLAGALSAAREWEEALPLFEALHAEEPNNAEYFDSVAACLRSLGRENEAVGRAESYVAEQLNLERGQTLLHVLQAARRGAKIAELRDVVLAGLDPSLAREVETRIADALAPLGGVPEKRQYLEDRVEEQRDANTIRTLSRFYLQYGWEDQAYELMLANIDTGAYDLYALSEEHLANAALRRGAIPEYIDLLWDRLAVEERYNRSYMMSRGFETCSQIGFAAPFLDRLVLDIRERGGAATNDTIAIVRECIDGGNDDYAIEILEQILAQNPYSHESRILKARVLQRAGQIDAMKALCDERTGAQTMMQELDDTLVVADLLYRAGQDAESDALVADVAAWARSAEANFRIGHYYASTWRCEKAAPYLETALQQNFRSNELLADIITVYGVLGRIDEARERYASFPAADNAEHLMMRLLAADAREALAALTSDQLARTPHVPEVIGAHALAQATTQGADAGIAVLEASHADASRVRQEQLAGVCAKLLLQEDLLEDVVAREETSEALAAGVAYAFYELSGLVPPTRARAIAPDVATLESDDPYVQYLLGEAFTRLEDPSNAAAHWNALLLNPGATHEQRKLAVTGLARSGGDLDPAAADTIETLLLANLGVVDSEPRVLRLVVGALPEQRAQACIDAVCALPAYEPQRECYRALAAHYRGDSAALDAIVNLVGDSHITFEQANAAADALEAGQRREDARNIYSHIAAGGFERDHQNEALLRLATLSTDDNAFQPALEAWLQLPPSYATLQTRGQRQILDALTPDDAPAFHDAVAAVLAARPNHPLADHLLGLYAEACEVMGAEPDLEALYMVAQLDADTQHRAVLRTHRIEAWQVAGPFYGMPLTDRPVPAPEPILALARGDAALDGADQPRWQATDETMLAGTLDLIAFYQIPASAANNREAYAMAWLESPDERTVTFAIGWDDYPVVWVNGEEVFSAETSTAVTLDQARFTAALRPGRNSILVRIINRSSDWALSLALADGAEGVAVADAPAAIQHASR